MKKLTEPEGRRIVCLPFFPGFYNSMLSGAVDDYQEREAEYMAEKEESQEYYPETYQPEHLRITASEYSSLFYDCCRYSLVYHKVARFWVEAFDLWCKNNLGTPEGSFTFEEMISPREYNFTTDVVYAYVPEAVITELFERSAKDNDGRHVLTAQEARDQGLVQAVDLLEDAMGDPVSPDTVIDIRIVNGEPVAYCIGSDGDGADISLGKNTGVMCGHKSLEKVIKSSFTSYDGFISFYPNDVEAWLEKPLDSWDYNELGTLLGAVMQLCGDFEDNDKFRDQLYEYTFSGNGEESEAWDAGMDWPKFEQKVAELRASKLEAHEVQIAEEKHNAQ